MQTTAAILCLYLIIYVFTSQQIARLSEEYIEDAGLGGKRKYLIDVEEIWAYILSPVTYILFIVGIITIAINTLWLQYLIKYPTMVFPKSECVSIIFFMMTLGITLAAFIETIRQSNRIRKTIRSR